MQENIPEENIPEENIIKKNIIILDNKITYYDLIYKKWCRKIDLIIKSIGYKYEDHEKKINSLDKILYSKIDTNNKKYDKILSNLDKKNQKYNKIIILLINKINKNNSTLIMIKRWVSIFMLIFVLFFIIILYIIWGIYLEYYIN